MGVFGRGRRDEVIGFALSGGGARAATQAGALRALSEAGISAAVIAGTSGGAVNAAWFALYPDRQDELEAIWCRLQMKDVFPGGRARMVFNMARLGYVHRSDAWEANLLRDIGPVNFEDAKIPFAVTAVRLSDGEKVVFDSGPVVPALMASTAIPGVFPPYEIDGELYVDGGVLDYLPVGAVVDRGATTIYALDCSWYPAGTSNRMSAVDRAALIASSEAVANATSLHAVRGRVVHRIQPPTPTLIDGRDFSRSAELIRLGYEHTRLYLVERELMRNNQETVS
jgi:NTE family protein